MVFPLTQPGGAQKYFIELAGNLNSAGTPVDIITMNRRFLRLVTTILHFYYRFDFKELFAKNLDKVEDRKKVLDRMNGSSWIEASLKDLRKILNRYDLIYTKNEVAELVLLKLLGYSKLPPIIVGVHTPVLYPFSKASTSKFHNFLYGSFFYKWLLKGIKLAHVVNGDDEKLLLNKFNVKTKLIHYPFSLDTDRETDQSKEFPTFNVLFVGRLSEQKGIDVLIEIIKILSKKDIFRNLHFKIAGFGDAGFEDQLKLLSKDFENVEYLEYVNSASVNKLYRWTDVTVIPSRYETVNYVALETGSHEKIAVATDIPGPRDVIINSKTGFLLKELSPEVFTDKIIDLYNLKKKNKEVFDKIGKEARKHIIGKFDPKTIYAKMHKMFMSTMLTEPITT